MCLCAVLIVCVHCLAPWGAAILITQLHVSVFQLVAKTAVSACKCV